MKKMISLIMCLAMVMSLASVSFADDGKMVPGTYTVTERGFDDNFVVAVTVDETSIQNVEVVETCDSLGMGEMAQKELAKEIVEKQSVNLDAMSGATISSVTFLYAVRNALKEAGATDDMFAEDCMTVKFTEKGDASAFQADIIVVGGGLAGVVSATTAAEKGAKVLLIEQANYLGGTSMYAGGAVAESGSELQPSESHNTITADSLKLWLKMSNGEQPYYNEVLGGAMADASGAAYDNLIRWGMKPTEMTFFGSGAGYYVWQEANGYTSTGWHIFHNMEPVMSELVDAGNLCIKMRTKATGISTDAEGKVNGVVTADGTVYNAGAVILATGGFTNNVELMEKIYARYGSYGAGTATAEMMQAAIELGAQTYAMDLTRWEPGMLNVTGKNNAQVEYEAIVANPGLVWVNKDGVRVSVEDAKNAAPWKAAENNTIYILLDQEIVDSGSVLKLGNSSNSQKDPDNRNFYKLLEAGKCIWSGDTVEEVAEKAGVNAAALAETVAKYNEYCAAGADADFGRDPKNMQSLEGKFYLIETIGGVKGTSGGLVIDEKAHVLDTNGNAIEGLYAAGEIGGTLQFNGNCVYNGGCFIICNAFGNIAANDAVEYVAGAAVENAAA